MQAAAARLVVSFLILVLTGCSRQPSTTYQGYAEGEYIAVSSPIGGTLEQLAVKRGDEVAVGAPLAVLEHAYETSMVAEAEQGLAQAEHRLADLGKGLRPPELAAITAELEQARVVLALAERELQRRARLYGEKVIAQETLDQAKSAEKEAKAKVAEIASRLASAKLGGREDAVKAATAEVAAAAKRLDQARWRLDQKILSAPKNGYIDDTYYQEGEYLPASSPVLSLLPPENITIRFFVPEPVVGTLSLGERVNVAFDGGGRPATATISYISSQAEFTPPVIYSRTTRAKLVYMVEARPLPTEATRFHPGQPVDVSLQVIDE